MPASLILKWGNVKGWDGMKSNPKALAALERYLDSGQGLSAMQRQDDAQRELICGIIDAVDGEIHDDWNGGTLTKDAAKAYVRDYGKPSAKTIS